MIRKCKEIDILVGIPSYNEADNIAFVARQLPLGLSRHFPSILPGQHPFIDKP